MIKELCWYETNIDTSFLLEENWTYKPRFHIAYNVAPIKEQFVKYLESLGLQYSDNIVFYKKGVSREWRLAHIDYYSTGELANPGLNYVIGGKGSLMRWYKMPYIDVPIKISPSGARYTEYSIDDLELIEETDLKENKLTLVRTDIPHTIYVKNAPRICISIRLKPKIHQSWESTVNFYKNKNLLILRN